MTFLEAVNTFERKAASLGFKYVDGEAVPAEVVMAWVGNFHGDKYDEVTYKLERNEIPVETYCLEMLRMVQEFSEKSGYPRRLKY